jgi:hypothetical protein
VAERASFFARSLDHERLELLVAAAYLHDVGYTPALLITGFHALDGAMYLRRLHVDERVVGLVANHTCAGTEARLRQLDQRLTNEFPKDRSLPHDELAFCDLTTGPDGEAVSLDERLIDVRLRYGPDDLIKQFIDQAEPEMRAVVQRAQALLSRPTVLV